MAAHIANPGGKVRYGDQVISQPGHQGGGAQALAAALAVRTGLRAGWVYQLILSYDFAPDHYFRL